MLYNTKIYVLCFKIYFLERFMPKYLRISKKSRTFARSNVKL